MSGQIEILAISGSLRTHSSNTALLHAAAQLAPAGIAVSVYDGVGDLPLFNPDLEGQEPVSVLELRRQLRVSHCVIISSPEYAHGVTGAIKNLLDWVVGSGELVDKPVALLNASARATWSHAALTEILTVMNARLIPAASLTIPLINNAVTLEDILSNGDQVATLRLALSALSNAVCVPVTA
ncbi:NADPH-dependent FMN reductase [Undibacterium terreum]|uniref:NAD(P)H-dependent oxidoreductase n=1 Tax=Undibacterium terreum TaxID=1224302 RepID=A0A916V2C6_9BURK|nr:NADPH-dependent FMN reductase [Undibacterium terreum]GGD01179.1 NAD(P)H-dependent oxidoreductase [Undibacterium terreum]